MQEKTLEICNNGIDDDGDGNIDCNDLEVRDLALVPEVRLPRRPVDWALVPLDGSTMSTTVQTVGNGDEFVSPCASASGGQDAVVDFTVPSKANVKLEWAQAGNHDFALYTEHQRPGRLQRGHAGRLHGVDGCSRPAAINLPALPGGKYHLIVDADKPGAEGGVVLQLSG